MDTTVVPAPGAPGRLRSPGNGRAVGWRRPSGLASSCGPCRRTGRPTTRGHGGASRPPAGQGRRLPRRDGEQRSSRRGCHWSGSGCGRALCYGPAGPTQSTSTCSTPRGACDGGVRDGRTGGAENKAATAEAMLWPGRTTRGP